MGNAPVRRRSGHRGCWRRVGQREYIRSVVFDLMFCANCVTQDPLNSERFYIFTSSIRVVARVGDGSKH